MMCKPVPDSSDRSHLGKVCKISSTAGLLGKGMLLKRGMGNGEWGMGNGEWGMGNGEWGMGNGEWGMGNGEWGMRNSGQRLMPKKLSWSLRSTAKKRGLHVESERWKVRIFICQFFGVFGIIEFLFIKINQKY